MKPPSWAQPKRPAAKPTAFLQCPYPECGGQIVRDMQGEWTCLLGGDRHVPNCSEEEMRGERRA